MKKSRRLTDLIPLMLLWLVLCAFFWGKVFMILTDTAPENKITVFIDARVPNETALAVELEKEMVSPIEMVKVHSFTYAMMSADALSAADIYIVPAANVQEYQEWFSQTPEEMLIYDGKAGAAEQYISYEDLPGEAYYLFFGKNSVHLTDGLAEKYAGILQKLP